MTEELGLFSLKGKHALVTGATGYLGRAMAMGLAQAGAHVLVNSRSHDRAQVLVDEIKSRGLNASSAVFDVTSEEEIEAFFANLKADCIDVLINNAYVGGGGTVASSNSSDYLDSYSITVVSAELILRKSLSHLRRAVLVSGGASVINLGSMYGLVSPDKRLYSTAASTNPPFYGAAKAALIQWTRYAACELGSEGIRVNSVSPGPFPADSVKERNPDFVELLSAKVPLGRIGEAHEIIGPIVFLASDAASYVNGANIVVDGGWTSW